MLLSACGGSVGTNDAASVAGSNSGEMGSAGAAANGGSGGQATPVANDGAAGSPSYMCTVELAAFPGTCLPTFDGSAAQVPPCGSFQRYLSQSACNGLLSYALGGGYGGQACYYDAVSHELVGAMADTDYLGYCNNTAFRINAGRLPGAACTEMMTEITCD